MEYHLAFQRKICVSESGVRSARCSAAGMRGQKPSSQQVTPRSRGGGSTGKPAGHCVGCLANPPPASWLVLTDNQTTGCWAFQHSAAFTVCGLCCYKLLSTSLFPSVKLFSCSLLQRLSRSVLPDVRGVPASALLQSSDSAQAAAW